MGQLLVPRIVLVASLIIEITVFLADLYVTGGKLETI